MNFGNSLRQLFIIDMLFCIVAIYWCEFSYGNQQKEWSQSKAQKSSSLFPYIQPLCENRNDNICPTWINTSMSEIEAALRCYSQFIPGFVVTVVYNANDSVIKNFGYSALDHPKKIIKLETKFAIGSLSKAFTATLLGILLSEQRERYPKSWDTKIIEIMGRNYSLTDELRSKHCTILDILAHRVGLQTYDLFLQTALDPKISLQDYCRRLHYVEKAGLFRSKYEYNNIMLILATCVAEKLGNNSFANLLKDKIFNPLGMNDTEVIIDSRIRNYKSLSKMYYRNELKETVPLSMDILRSVETLIGAGGIVSTGRDICKWIKFHLNQGRNDEGKQLIPVSYWTEMHSRHMIAVRSRRPSHVERPVFPVTNTVSAFGLGWRVGYYRGFSQSEHTGEIGSFISKITLLHSKGIGIFTIANGPAHFTGELQMAVHFYLLDNLLKEKTWLNSTTICTFPRPWATSAVPRINQPSRQISTSLKTNLSLFINFTSNYVGSYGHPIFGNFTILRNCSLVDHTKLLLHFRIGLLGSGSLEFINVSTAFLEFTGVMRYIRPRSFAVLYFLNQNIASKRYEVLAIYGFGSHTPLIFRRDLPWEPLTASDRKSGSDRLAFIIIWIYSLILFTTI